MIPIGYDEIQIHDDVCEWDLEGCYLYNKRHRQGGFFSYGNDRGFSIGGIWESSQTGDSLYDHITICGYKVYKKAI
jgi:hypothetical protein